MRRLIWMLPALALAMGLAGCGSSSIPLQEVSERVLDEGARSFADAHRDQTGLFLYQPAGRTPYLMVTYTNVKQGEEAKYIRSTDAEIQNRTLFVHLQEARTMDYGDSRPGQMHIYRLKENVGFDKVRVMVNGSETRIDQIGG